MLCLLYAEFWAGDIPNFKYFTIIGVYLTFVVTCVQLAVSVAQLKEIEEYKSKKITEANNKIIS